MAAASSFRGLVLSSQDSVLALCAINSKGPKQSSSLGWHRLRRAWIACVLAWITLLLRHDESPRCFRESHRGRGQPRSGGRHLRPWWALGGPGQRPGGKRRFVWMHVLEQLRSTRCGPKQQRYAALQRQLLGQS